MSGGLSSSCLQQRDGGYPYMFPDALHPLSGYGPRSGCGPAAAHQQPLNPHASYGTGSASSGSTGLFYYTHLFKYYRALSI